MVRKRSIILAVVLLIFAASPNVGDAQSRGGWHGGAGMAAFGAAAAGVGAGQLAVGLGGPPPGLGLGLRLGPGVGLGLAVGRLAPGAAGLAMGAGKIAAREQSCRKRCNRAISTVGRAD